MSARIQQIYIAMFGRPADPLGLAFWNSQTNNGANLAPIINALSGTPEYQARFAGQSNVQLVNSIYQSLFGRDADVAGLTFFANALASGRQSLASIAVNILDGAQGTDLTRITNKVTAATNFTNAIDTTPEILAYNASAVSAAQAFLTGVTDNAATIPSTAATDAAVAAIVSGGSSGAPGTTFTLVTGVDNIAGTVNNDVVNAYINVGTPASSTLTGADVINGGTGTDSLNITVENGAGALPGATISSIENFFIRDIGGGGTYNFGVVTGEQQVWSDRSTAATTFNNLGTGAVVGLKGDGTTTLGNVTFTMATATDPIAIALDGGTLNANITRNDTGKADVTITSTGAANKVGTIDLDNAATTIAALTINATTNLTASLAADYAANATLVVKGAATLVDLSGAGLSANFKSVDASGMTAGGVSVVMGANTTSFVGGAGADTVAVNTLVYGGTVKLDGGNGTDIVQVTDAAALTKATGANIVNFETLRIADDDDGAADTFDASLIAGVTSVQVNAISAGDAVTVNGLSAALAQAVTIRGTSAENLTFGVTKATDVGQLDTLKLTIDDGVAAKNTVTVANVTAAGVESVSIAAVDNFTASSLTGLTGLTGLTVSGVGNVSLTTGALALTLNTVVDASAVTGTVTFNAADATTNGLKVTTGTGADTVTGTAQSDIILTGAGKDTITGGNGIDTITTGADRDTVVTATAAANRDVITDFTVGANGDALSFAGLKANNTAAAAGDAATAAVVNVGASGNLTGAAGQFVFQIGVENVTGAFSTDGASVLNALVTGAASGTVTAANAADVLIFLVSNGTDTAVYRGVANGVTNDTAITADEISLIGTLQGVTSAGAVIGGTNGNLIFA